MLVNAVRATAQQIISQWLITLSVGRPNVTKTFQVIVPAQVQTVVHKVKIFNIKYSFRIFL